MIDHIEHLGKLVDTCSLPGEGKGDIVAPAHPNGIQLSRDRFLLLIATNGYRSVDDSRSVIWQLRKDSYAGPILKEGFFSQTTNDWDPFNLGVTWKKETGAMTAFGVPKGALINGQRVAHENVFACKFRVCARTYHSDGDYISWYEDDPRIVRSHRIHWVQFRLSDAENDLEILQEEQMLRQTGYDDAEQFCALDIVNLNQTFAGIWPSNDDCTQWVDVHHAATAAREAHLLVTGYRFNAETGLYEWNRTGPRIGDNLFEASILPYQDRWLLAARQKRLDGQKRPGVAWALLDTPFDAVTEWTVPDDIQSCDTPLTAYLCPDGLPRLLSGDHSRSPYAPSTTENDWIDNRNPLYMWEICPEDGFRMKEAHLVFDMLAAGIPVDRAAGPVADMGKLLPHAGGREQFLVHRVRSCTLRVNEPWEQLQRFMKQKPPYLTDEHLDASGIYYAKVCYADDVPPMWKFAM